MKRTMERCLSIVKRCQEQGSKILEGSNLRILVIPFVELGGKGERQENRLD